MVFLLDGQWALKSAHVVQRPTVRRLRFFLFFLLLLLAVSTSCCIRWPGGTVIEDRRRTRRRTRSWRTWSWWESNSTHVGICLPFHPVEGTYWRTWDAASRLHLEANTTVGTSSSKLIPSSVSQGHRDLSRDPKCSAAPGVLSKQTTPTLFL